MLKPYHEHPLLKDYSEWIGAQYYFAAWFCPRCKLCIVGPPWQIGEYVVARETTLGLRHAYWCVYMRSQFPPKDDRLALFESTSKREATKHARMLERERQHIAKALAGDPVAVAENYKRVEAMRRREQEQ
jgi:hypothetical protein